MEKFRGLVVPVEPKKAWRGWMTGSEFCDMRDGVVDCNSLSCQDCVYSTLNWTKRRDYYNSKFPSDIEMFEGLKVPVPAKKDWYWMSSADFCSAKSAKCSNMSCRDCIYSFSHYIQRAKYYGSLFGEKKAAALPKRDSKGRFISKVKDETPDLPVQTTDPLDAYRKKYTLSEALRAASKLNITIKVNND